MNSDFLFSFINRGLQLYQLLWGRGNSSTRALKRKKCTNIILISIHTNCTQSKKSTLKWSCTNNHNNVCIVIRVYYYIYALQVNFFYLCAYLLENPNHNGKINSKQENLTI